jgi:thiol-disulfide isomerase/thioredoxin
MKRFVVLLLLLLLIGCKESAPVGGVISLDEYETIKEQYIGKVLVINVFASWCPPCLEETPDFVQFYGESDRKNFEIIGLSIDENFSNLGKFLSRFKVNYQTYVIDEKVRRRLYADKIPITVVYKPNGQYFTTVLGMVNKKTLADLIKRAQED